MFLIVFDFYNIDKHTLVFATCTGSHSNNPRPRPRNSLALSSKAHPIVFFFYLEATGGVSPCRLFLTYKHIKNQIVFPHKMCLHILVESLIYLCSC